MLLYIVKCLGVLFWTGDGVNPLDGPSLEFGQVPFASFDLTDAAGWHAQHLADLLLGDAVAHAQFAQSGTAFGRRPTPGPTVAHGDERPVWIGNGVLDRFLEDESLFGEFLRTPVSEGGVESLVVGPPHIVVEVGA